MTNRWQDVRCASIRAEDLPVLADLRREAGIRATIDQGRAWICWDDETGDATRKVLVAQLLPLAGVETFTRRDGRWYRLGESLPAFHVPVGDGSAGGTLDRVIVPQRSTFARPESDAPRPVPLHLVRDPSGEPRPGLRGAMPVTPARRVGRECALAVDRVGVRGLLRATAGGDDAEVLLIGLAGRLPAVQGAMRFWGSDVLIPLGYRAEPELADRALRDAVRAEPDDLVVFETSGLELIPRKAFRPLCRAGIRLALLEMSRGRASEEA